MGRDQAKSREARLRNLETINPKEPELKLRSSLSLALGDNEAIRSFFTFSPFIGCSCTVEKSTLHPSHRKPTPPHTSPGDTY
jgi:hypothetical protein